MQKLWIGFKLLLLSWSLSIDCKLIHKGPLNETLLTGQIHAPSGDPARNLMGMVLSMNVFVNHTVLHSSLVSIKNNTFPLNYSLELTDHDFLLENATSFHIVSMIWQPAYIYESHIKLKESKVDTLNLNMRTIKFVIIRGEIVHEKHNAGHELPATQIKLELIENRTKGHIIDQVDFMCTSKTYPCPFEYWLNTARIKANMEYKLEAIISDRVLPPRKNTNQKHANILVETRTSVPKEFAISPTVDTEINKFKIVVFDV
ncbi:unnamed protein product [Rotaria magnacalcarata]|uniref:Uncharacterized protein n=1 Tax=Rotaria magnacalcarata TaxID=392030 RepID=A0A816WK78_9BILA|nr:unnamed protein product [Rotaria magnacalcarata]CAF4071108.1 unnamed protein product [Rotaria magnacalcarata]